MMNKIAVIGTGYVGLVSGTCFADIGNRVICCDINQSKIDRLNLLDIPIYEPGLEELVRKNIMEERLFFTTNIAEAIQSSTIIYIAVGTPMSKSGEADLQYVRAAAATIAANLNDYKIIVMKSTVPVGTGRMVYDLIKHHSPASSRFDVVSNPEFLREGSAIYDCMNMERTVIGATTAQAANAIAQLHEPFHTQVVLTDLESAEMIKYAANAFLATKISYMNAIANLCERLGADIIKVTEGLGLDSRIGKKFLNAGIGYGGSCFPKDTEALRFMSRQVDYDFKILDSVIETNQSQRMIVVKKLVDAIGNVKGKKIAILGLAFKPNTNDVRCSPALDVIECLLELGAEIKAYDPIANEEARKQLGDRISYHENPYSALADCDAGIIVTEWQDVVSMDLNKVSSIMRFPIIIDGRNCYDLELMEEHGFEYRSIGRANIKGNQFTRS